MSLKEIINMENYKKHAFIVNLIVLTILFFAHCFSGYVVYAIFPLLMAMIIFDDIKNGLSYLLFSIPLFFISITINLVFFGICVVTFFIKYIVIRYAIHKEKVDKKLLILFIIFVAYSLCSFGSYSPILLIKLLMIFLFFALVFLLTKDPEIINIKFNMKVLTIALVLSTLFSLTYYISPFVNDYLSIEKSGRFKALFPNVNTLAMCCEMACSVFLYYILSGKSKNEDLILFFLLIVLGLLTSSKTFLILITIMLISIVVYFFIKERKKTLIVLSCFALFFGVILLIDFNFVKSYFLRFLDNRTEFSSFADFMNVLTTSRYDLWLVYINEMICHPLIAIFGVGLGARPLPPRNISSHNFYIAGIYQLGLIGSILFVSIIVYMLVKYFKETKISINASIVIPCFIWILLSFVEDLIFYMY